MIGIEMSETAGVLFGIIITLFTGAWIVFGIRWVRKAANSFTSKPSK